MLVHCHTDLTLHMSAWRDSLRLLGISREVVAAPSRPYAEFLWTDLRAEGPGQWEATSRCPATPVTPSTASPSPLSPSILGSAAFMRELVRPTSV